MGRDEAALVRLWREKRGEVGPEDLSGNLVVQLGRVTEELNRRWYEVQSGQEVVEVQKHIRHSGSSVGCGATLDGRVRSSGAVYETKFMLPWWLLGRGRRRRYRPQLQHNMWVMAAWVGGAFDHYRRGKWVEIKTHADPLTST